MRSAEPSLLWARSGAMWLTGRADGPALPVAGGPAEQVARQLATLAAPGASMPGVELLGERAALAGLARRGAVSAGGGCRLLPARDGWVAISLPRPSDVDLLPALMEGAVDEPWVDLMRWLDHTTADDAVDRATLLGMAASRVPDTPLPPGRAAVVRTDGGPRDRRLRPRVLDLSSLWAGPLCARLLGLLGADVVKVESTTRPDGARGGERRFFDLLHVGHRSVAVDFPSTAGREALHRLVRWADVVIEASRPRALRQLGIAAEQAVADGVVWVSITGYGRETDGGRRVGFGDDVAAGAGLVAWDAAGPVFAGDALADPLAGVQAAAAVAEALGRPIGCLLDVSMHDTARAAANGSPGPLACPEDVVRPAATPPAETAAPLGADTADVLDAID